jgi:hypothetical protein
VEGCGFGFYPGLEDTRGSAAFLVIRGAQGCVCGCEHGVWPGGVRMCTGCILV